ncbi:MAG TPA: hypothetical protein VGP42_10660 [Stellaceae bacterium]|jgi:hypothetical protein|nr:hypothetical protein [Stellaceae bacterium]
MQKGVARPVSQLDEAEAFLRFEPFNGCLNRRSRGFLEAWPAEAGGGAEIAGRRLEIMIVEAAPAPLAKIPVLVQEKGILISHA